MEHTSFLEIFKQSTGVSTDTRTIQKGNLFFALKGTSFDGNTHAQKAIDLGASYAIIDDANFQNEKTILVNNVLEYLQRFAKFYREQLHIPIIAITGSNGKTTTKELIHAVLSKKYKTRATKGNLNNHIGVPLTLLSIQADDEMAIVEMGANHQEEIKFLCQLAQPDYGMITNIGKAHLEGFGGLDGVKKGKGEMYDYLQENNKKIFVNGDDTVLMKILKQKKITDYITYGKNKNNQFQADFSKNKVTLTIEYQEQTIATNMYGYYNFPNYMAAISIGAYFSVPITGIAEALASYTPTNHRSQITTWHGSTLIMDSYNANPSSMQVAIENFAMLDAKNKMVILGDMFELGEESRAEHIHILQSLNEQKFQKIILVGNEMQKVKESLPEATYFINSQALKEFLVENDYKDYYILVKGSRGVGLEQAFVD